MLDSETRKLVETARGRRQIELSARLSAVSSAPRRPDLARSESARAWDEMKVEIAAAVRAHEADGLRVLRYMKTRPEMVITGPVATWRRFLEHHRELVSRRSVEFRHYIKPWGHGLPGFPE